MKNIFIWIIILLAVTVSSNIRGQEKVEQAEISSQYSTVPVIAWFSKHDTVYYWVNESSWRINGADTVRTSSQSMRVRINVVDSAATGYKLEYTFLEFPTENLPETASFSDIFQNQIVARLAKKIEGTTVSFETDDCGRITGINNLGRIKKQAKSLFNEAIKEFSVLPEMQEAKELGFDIRDYAKKIDMNQLVDGYLEELNLLFLNHGNEYTAGEFKEYEDATDSTFESTTVISANVDSDGCYSVMADITNILTRKYIKELVGNVVGLFNNDSINDSFITHFDSQVKVNGVYEDYLKTDYLPNGWPFYLVKQQSTKIGQLEKVKQKVISLDSYYFAP